MEVKLTNCTVVIKDALSWGDSKRIQAAMIGDLKVGGGGINVDGKGTVASDVQINASHMIEGTYASLECAVIEITEGEEKKKFSREWMDNLSISDGDKLVEAIDKMSKKK